jgi:response regulator NasT
MTRSLRIAVADDEVDMRDFLERFLPVLGHQVISVADSGRQLVEHCQRNRPDLIITDIKMPDMDGIEAVNQICRDDPVPVILLSAYHDPETARRAEGENILGYLVKPVTEKDLGPAISLAAQRFEQFRVLRKEAADLRRTLEDRKSIERAKGIVLKRMELDESEAFRRMQKLASNKNWKLIEVARMIQSAEEVFQLLEHSH